MTKSDYGERLEERFGKFYGLESAALKLEMNKLELGVFIDAGYVLAPHTSDGVMIIPSVQFIDGRYSVPLARILATMKALSKNSMDAWSKLYWITNPLEQFGERSALQVIEGGDDGEYGALMKLAEADATSFANMSSGGEA